MLFVAGKKAIRRLMRGWKNVSCILGTFCYQLHLLGEIVNKKKLFVAFPWVVTSTGPGGFMICVFII